MLMADAIEKKPLEAGPGSRSFVNGWDVHAYEVANGGPPPLMLSLSLSLLFPAEDDQLFYDALHQNQLSHSNFNLDL